MTLEFAHPSDFQWIFLVIAVFFVVFFFEKRARSQVQKVFHPKLWNQLTSSLSLRKRRMKWICYVLAGVCFVVALAQPRFGEALSEMEASGIELMILADVSESMLAEDLRPNRLEQMKADLSRLADLLLGNKVGVIAFAGSASLLCPLTIDPSAVKMYAESLSPLSVSTQGTHFSAALTAAKETFQRGGVESKSRAIVILSDGEDHEQGALDLATELAAQGVAIFTVAYGTEKGGAIPERDSLGYLMNYKKDRSGQAVVTTVKGDFLKTLAEEGKGQFYFAVPGGDQLKRLANKISEFEKSEFAKAGRKRYFERFQVPLFMGLCFLAFGFLLSERARVIVSSRQGRIQ